MTAVQPLNLETRVERLKEKSKTTTKNALPVLASAGGVIGVAKLACDEFDKKNIFPEVFKEANGAKQIPSQAYLANPSKFFEAVYDKSAKLAKKISSSNFATELKEELSHAATSQKGALIAVGVATVLLTAIAGGVAIKNKIDNAKIDQKYEDKQKVTQQIAQQVSI